MKHMIDQRATQTEVEQGGERDHHWQEMRVECRWTRSETDRGEAGVRDERSWITRDNNNKS